MSLWVDLRKISSIFDSFNKSVETSGIYSVEGNNPSILPILSGLYQIPCSGIQQPPQQYSGTMLTPLSKYKHGNIGLKINQPYIHQLSTKLQTWRQQIGTASAPDNQWSLPRDHPYNSMNCPSSYLFSLNTFFLAHCCTSKFALTSSRKLTQEVSSHS